jgi:hypothetical protein
MMSEARCWNCGRFCTDQCRVTIESGGAITVSDTCARAECHEGIAMSEAEAEMADPKADPFDGLGLAAKE